MFVEGKERLVALVQKSFVVATRTEVVKPADFTKPSVDTTVIPENVMFPTDAKLLRRVQRRLVRLAREHGLTLPQSYARVAKYALIKHQA